MPRIVVDVALPLRPLLPPRERVRALERDVAPTETVVHLLQTVGIPRTEAGDVLIEGRRVPRDELRTTRLERPATLHVEVRNRPQSNSGRFLLDVHLGSLARRMRLLGIEAAYDPQADDAELATRAAAEERVLLTRDRGLLFRSLVPDGALLRFDSVDDQLHDVLDRFAPPVAPWTRCPRCGALLAEASAEEVVAELKPGTRRTYSSFSRCTGCAQVYWRGAHTRNLEQLIERALDST